MFDDPEKHLNPLKTSLESAETSTMSREVPACLAYLQVQYLVWVLRWVSHFSEALTNTFVV